MIFKAILRIVSKLLIPPIMLFALYVQFHGDFGPGGGFQAGVIFASAFILYALIFGIDNARKVAPAWATRTLLALGLLLYASVGVAGIFLGGTFLDYSVLADNPGVAEQRRELIYAVNEEGSRATTELARVMRSSKAARGPLGPFEGTIAQFYRYLARTLLTERNATTRHLRSA